MGYQDKPRRIRVAVGLAAVVAVSSTLAAHALDAGSLLAPILTPVTGGPGAPVAPFSAPAGGHPPLPTRTLLPPRVGGAPGRVGGPLASTPPPPPAPPPSA